MIWEKIYVEIQGGQVTPVAPSWGAHGYECNLCELCHLSTDLLSVFFLYVILNVPIFVIIFACLLYTNSVRCIFIRRFGNEEREQYYTVVKIPHPEEPLILTILH